MNVRVCWLIFIDELEKEINPCGSSLASMMTLKVELAPMLVGASDGDESSTVNSSSI